MTFVLLFLVYAHWPDVSVTRHPTWDACQEAGLTLADVEMKQRRRVWFKCLEIAG